MEVARRGSNRELLLNGYRFQSHKTKKEFWRWMVMIAAQ